MYCSNCGTQNNDDSLFCTKCGKKLIEETEVVAKMPEKNKTDNAKNEARKSILFSAHLLNIIAFCLPILLILGMTFIIPQVQDSNPEPAGGLSVEVTGPTLPINSLFICFLVGVIIFIIGLILYFKPEKKKLILAYIYLFLAIGDLIILFFLFMLVVLSTCGFGSVAFIPGILQIIAGSKFVKAMKMYED